MVLGISYTDDLDLIIKFIGCYNFMLEPSLSDKEIQLTAALIQQNIKYIENGVKDPETRLDLMFTKKSKEAIREALGFKQQELENYIAKIKKKDVFKTKLFTQITNIKDLFQLQFNYVRIQSPYTPNSQESSQETQLALPNGGENLSNNLGNNMEQGEVRYPDYV